MDQKHITIERRSYSADKLNQVYPRVNSRKRPFYQNFRENFFCTKTRALNIITSLLPVIKFVTDYRVRNVMRDVLGGLTVTLLHLYQGITFAILAGLKPEHGLYTSCFPVLLYLLFGTSCYISFGPNVMMAILTRKIIDREVSSYVSEYSETTAAVGTDYSRENVSNTSTLITMESFNTTMAATTRNSSHENIAYTTSATTGYNVDRDLDQLKLEIAMTASLLVGIFLTLLGIIRFGWLTSYLSYSFVGGFTTALSIHIASMEITKLFGISVPIHLGAGRLVFLYIDLFTKIKETVVSDITISILTLGILLISRIITDHFKRQLKVPLPIELLLIGIGMIASYFGKLDEMYNVSVLPSVQTGFLTPSIPTLNNISTMMIKDCIIMAILSYVISISTTRAAIKDEKKQHNIEENQELIAHGISNIVSSFFFCLTQSTSPPRTMILKFFGAKSTLHGAITGLLMVLVIFWIGHIFQWLPSPIVASVIVVSLRDLFQQFKNLPELWKINKFDFCTWIVTFLVSVFADLDYGLFTGIAFSFIAVVLHLQFARGRVIGFSDIEDLALEVKGRIHVREFPSIKVFMFESPIIFANADIFRQQLFRQTIDLQNNRMKAWHSNGSNESRNTPNRREQDMSNGRTISNNMEEDISVVKLKHVVIDCQRVNNIDVSGVNVLTEIVNEYKSISIDVYFTNCSKKMIEILKAADFFETFPKERMFHDVYDAIYSINPFSDGNRQKGETKEENTKL